MPSVNVTTAIGTLGVGVGILAPEALGDGADLGACFGERRPPAQPADTT